MKQHRFRFADVPAPAPGKPTPNDSPNPGLITPEGLSLESHYDAIHLKACDFQNSMPGFGPILGDLTPLCMSPSRGPFGNTQVFPPLKKVTLFIVEI